MSGSKIPRSAALLLLSLSPLCAQTGLLDPVFRGVPFESWFSGDQAHIRWNSEVPDPILSPHERLLTTIKIKIDGQELAARRGKGQIGLMIQLRDSTGALWQTHDGIDLTKLQDGVEKQDIEYQQSLFVLPGEYEVSLAIVSTASGEHAVARRKLKVAPLKGDPLPNAWRDMPAVEFIRSKLSPDSFFLPEMKGRVRLVAKPKRPVNVEILVNLTPTERLSGSNRSKERSLSLLLPAMKLFLDTDWGGDVAMRVSFLDLATRKVIFDQDNINKFDWEKARATLADAAPGVIDVKALENRRFSANFFTQEVARRMEKKPGDPLKIVIVLSTPVAFEAGVERHLIEAEANSDVHVFYVRYHPYTGSIGLANPLQQEMNQQMRGRRDPFGGDVVFHPAPPGSQDDHLVPLLKPIRPELFDVSNPDQFRHALASIIDEASRL